MMSRAVRLALLLLLGAVLVRTAWLCDDAYISFRTVRNFVEGEGLRWNLVERVQAYTHPLWLFLLSGAYALTHEIYLTSIAVSLLVSLAAAWLLGFRLAPHPVAGAFALALLASSRSFVDYSTSGLENPLVHLLLGLLVVVYLERPDKLLAVAGVAALAAVTRLDTVLLTTPLVAAAWWRVRSLRAAALVAAGYAPLVAWELFSIVYYGVPFPNTAYAKIAGLPAGELVSQGAAYLESCARFDPVAALALVAAVLLAFVPRARRLLPAAAGIVVYLAYLVKIGGDFMAGRFLTAPLVLATAILVQLVPRGTFGFIPAALALLVGLSRGDESTFVSGGDYGTRRPWREYIDQAQIADERAIYYKITGVLRNGAAFRTPEHRWFDAGRAIPAGGVGKGATMGFTGWAAPRDAYIVDQLALTDPFLARLPPRRNPGWRPGHLDRDLPAGYFETRRARQNRLDNRWLAAAFDDISLVTSGPLFSGERWRAIWRLNTGQLEGLIAHAGDVQRTLAQVAGPRREGDMWNAPGNVVVPAGGTLFVDLGAPMSPRALELSADWNDAYDVTLLRGEAVVGKVTAGPRPSGKGLAVYRLELPGVEIDRLRVTPRGGDYRYAVGHLRLR